MSIAESGGGEQNAEQLQEVTQKSVLDSQEDRQIARQSNRQKIECIDQISILLSIKQNSEQLKEVT